MTAAEDKNALLQHLSRDHPGLDNAALSLHDLETAHNLRHAFEQGKCDHVHGDERPLPAAVTETSKSFHELAEAEMQRLMVEAQKRYEAAWQAVVGAVQRAGQAKAVFNVARKEGNNVLMAATDFRKAEQEVVSAVAAIIDLIAKESE